MLSICADVFRVKGNGEDCESFRTSKKNTGGRGPPVLTPKLLAVSDRLLRFRAHGGTHLYEKHYPPTSWGDQGGSSCACPIPGTRGRMPRRKRQRGRRRRLPPRVLFILHPSSFILHPSSFMPHPSRFRQGHRPLLGGDKIPANFFPSGLILVPLASLSPRFTFLHSVGEGRDGGGERAGDRGLRSSTGSEVEVSPPPPYQPVHFIN